MSACASTECIATCVMLASFLPAVSLPFDQPLRMLICPLFQSMSCHFNPKVSLLGFHFPVSISKQLHDLLGKFLEAWGRRRRRYPLARPLLLLMLLIHGPDRLGSILAGG